MRCAHPDFASVISSPPVVATQADLECLQKAIGRAPQETAAVDVEKQEVPFGDRVIKATVPDGPRNQLVAGTWDSTALLLEAGTAIEATLMSLVQLGDGFYPRETVSL